MYWQSNVARQHPRGRSVVHRIVVTALLWAIFSVLLVLPPAPVAAQQPTPEAEDTADEPSTSITETVGAPLTRTVGWKQLGASRLPGGLHRTSFFSGAGAPPIPLRPDCIDQTIAGWASSVIATVIAVDYWGIGMYPCVSDVDPNMVLYVTLPNGQVETPTPVTVSGSNQLAYRYGQNFPFMEGIYTFTAMSDGETQTHEFTVQDIASAEPGFSLAIQDPHTDLPRSRFAPGETIQVVYSRALDSDAEQEALVELYSITDPNIPMSFGEIPLLITAWQISFGDTQEIVQHLPIPGDIEGTYYLAIRSASDRGCDISLDLGEDFESRRWPLDCGARFLEVRTLHVDRTISPPQEIQIGDAVSAPAKGYQGTLDFMLAGQRGNAIQIEALGKPRLMFKTLDLVLRNDQGIAVATASWDSESSKRPAGATQEYLVPQDGAYLLEVTYFLHASCPECEISLSVVEDETAGAGLPTLGELGTSASATCTVAVETLNLRPGPGTDFSPVLARLTRGTEIVVEGWNTNHDWLKVSFQESLYETVDGWVINDSEYITCDSQLTGLRSIPFELSPGQVRADQLFAEGLSQTLADMESALAAFTDAYTLEPGALPDPSVVINHLLARNLWERGLLRALQRDLVSAIADLESAMELDSTLQGDPRTIAERIASESLIRELYADAGLFGSSFLSEIELETAESTLTLAGTMNPSLEIRPEEDSRRLVAHNLYFRGQASAYSDQDWSGALTLFEQARSLEPRLERIDRAFRAARLMMEGYDLAGLGEIDAALAKYEQAIAIEPALFKSWLDPRGVYAAMFVLEGQAQANQGNVDAATASFERAMLLDPALAIEPEQVARSIFARVLVDQGGTLAQQGDIETAVANFAEALDLDPALDILAYNWNTLCWFGSLHGHAALVLDACEQAVLESPDDGRYRQSRGLARALTGNTAGAIEDLQYYVTWAEQNWNNEEEIQQREAWIAALQAGENPFDQETLEALLIE